MICVKHSIITTLTTGAYVGFLRGGTQACDSWRSQAFARAVRGHASREFFLNYATWCVLEHIFINFLLEKINNKLFFIQK